MSRLVVENVVDEDDLVDYLQKRNNVWRSIYTKSPMFSPAVTGASAWIGMWEGPHKNGLSLANGPCAADCDDELVLCYWRPQNTLTKLMRVFCRWNLPSPRGEGPPLSRDA